MVKIFGKEVDVTYYVNESRDANGKLKCKPSIVSKKGKPSDLYIKSEQESDIPSNASFVTIDGKKCGVIRWEYDSDNGLSVLVIDYTKENSINKDECKDRCEILLEEWNAQVISDSPKISAWCKLHDKKPEDVDADELKKLLSDCGSITISSDDLFCVSTSQHTHNSGQHTHSLNVTNPISSYPYFTV